MSGRLSTADRAFAAEFGADAEPSVAHSAPGRVNLIGGHTDYNDGFVLPAAIDRRTVVAARPRDDGRLRIHSPAFDETVATSAADIEPVEETWANYVLGPAAMLADLEYDLPGADLVVVSDVPMGAGLASSAALELAAASRSSFGWTPESALVLGNGSLGLLALALLRTREDFERLYCLGRRDRPDPTIEVIERLGATYVDSRQTPLAAVPEAHEPMDLVFEATGSAKHALDTVAALAPNGVGALLGVPEPWEFEVDGGSLHRDLVLHNKALVGSVNSNVRHFEAAAATLEGLPAWFTDAMVSGIYGLDDFEAAFDDDDTTIKTAVQFSAYEER